MRWLLFVRGPGSSRAGPDRNPHTGPDSRADTGPDGACPVCADRGLQALVRSIHRDLGHQVPLD